MRRVVTGRDSSGKSIVVEDADVQPKSVAALPSSTFCHLWGSDERVALPSDGSEPKWTQFFPPAAGFRFLVWTLPPDGAGPPADLDLTQAITEINQILPGLIEYNEPDNPGMHTTDTIDWDYVVSGEVWLELDDGAEVHLTAGDSVIQNGTRHAWHNRTDQPTTIVTAIVGASTPLPSE
jgi:hypothetical protein